MTGIQEGWLGPLEKPEEPEAESTDSVVDKLSESPTEAIQEIPAESSVNDIPVESIETASQAVESSTESGPAAKESDQQDKRQDDGEKKEEKKKPVPKPYILAQDYAEAPTPDGFEQHAQFKPIAALGHPHILGFRHTPIRVYRYFTRRHLADKMGAATAAVIFGATRPFDIKEDSNLLVHEEDDWPKWWKKQAVENGSEWVQPFIVDERIGSRLSVYRPQDDITDSLSSEFANDQ
jgi:import inner membrane translocase subunit TIM54